MKSVFVVEQMYVSKKWESGEQLVKNGDLGDGGSGGGSSRKVFMGDSKKRAAQFISPAKGRRVERSPKKRFGEDINGGLGN